MQVLVLLVLGFRILVSRNHVDGDQLLLPFLPEFKELIFGPLGPPEIAIFEAELLFNDVPPPPAIETGLDEVPIVALGDDGVVVDLDFIVGKHEIGQIDGESEVDVAAQFDLELQLLLQFVSQLFGGLLDRHDPV